MYALVVCLDNVKRVIPVDYIQRHEDDDRITVYIPDKQRFCNAVVLQKGESKEILEEQIQELDGGILASSSKRKVQSSASPLSPSPKRLNKDIQKESSCTNAEEHHVRISDPKTITQHQFNGCSPHPLTITSRQEEENSKRLGLHSDVDLSQVLCELLQDQRALKQQVQNIERTMQEILETLIKTDGVVGSHSEVTNDYCVKNEPLDEQVEDCSISAKVEEPRPPVYPCYVVNSESSDGESATFERLSPQTDLSIIGTSELPQLERQQTSNGHQSNSLLQPLEIFSSFETNSSAVKTIDLSTDAPGTQRCRLVQNDFVVIPIKFDSTNAKEEYIAPVLISCVEYHNILLKSKTSTAFLRSLLKFFFSVETLKTHNYEGGEVHTKNGKAMRGQLNRRMVTSLIEQVELEFPGTTKGFENMKYIKKSINDKCNHM
ncbi:uncharacterized protein [Asterias amurensis]|uniref:uncharacterized protein n=1 Tax=Asterias amurensis TaxID=7602 RepID=UPI003AB8FB6B